MISLDEFTKSQKSIVNLLQMLMNFSEDHSFDDLIKVIKQFIDGDLLYSSTIFSLMIIFRIIRPKCYEVINKIENVLNVSAIDYTLPFDFISNCSPLLFSHCPQLLNFESLDSYVSGYISCDDLKSVQCVVLKNQQFDFNCKFEPKDVNLLDISAFYGSIKCFKYLLLNNSPFSRNIGAYAVAGGNIEVVKLIESIDMNHLDSDVCCRASIIFHRYDIIYHIIRDLGHQPNAFDVEASINSLNFIAYEFLRELGLCANMCNIISLSSKNNNIFMINWLIMNNHEQVIDQLLENEKNEETKAHVLRTYIFYLLKDKSNPEDVIEVLEWVLFKYQ